MKDNRIIALMEENFWYLDDNEHVFVCRTTEEAKELFKQLRDMACSVEKAMKKDTDSGITFREEIRHARMCDQ